MVKTKRTHNRTFAFVSANGKHMGRYISKTPSGSARKIGSRLLKKRKVQSTTISVQEITLGSKKGIFHYTVRRVKLPKQKIIVRNGKRVSYKYKTVVKARKH